MDSLIPTPTPNESPLSEALLLIQSSAQLAALVAPLTGPAAPEVAAGAAVAAAVIGIIQHALTVHQQALGMPLDLSQLHQIAPVV
jgi:hypothetical protein